MKSVALRPYATIQALPPKQVLAQITALGVIGAKGLRTLPSGRTEIVFTDEVAATAAKARPTWVKALDPQASLYERLFSVRVLSLQKDDLLLFQDAKHAIENENDIRVHDMLVSQKKKAVTIQVTSIDTAHQLINQGLFLEARAFPCERWQATTAI